jgi:hypothetical protein
MYTYIQELEIKYFLPYGEISPIFSHEYSLVILRKYLVILRTSWRHNARLVTTQCKRYKKHIIISQIKGFLKLFGKPNSKRMKSFCTPIFSFQCH